IQDEARRAQGVEVAHAGGDPFATLGLLGHLRSGGVVALQMDRMSAGMRARRVTLFGRPSYLPEGPLRLASVAGAPIVPVFASRAGHRHYEMRIEAPVHLPRRPTEAELDAAAQGLADSLAAFVRARPTQWFNFRAPTVPDGRVARGRAP
ncbi:MAG: lysophospholipid acyltransferase family protein, partial [Polyangiaceae bacterium]